MIVSLLIEEKRMKIHDTKYNSHTEMVLFSKGRVNKNKNSVECFYCQKHGHTTFSWKTCAKELLNGKLKESTNMPTLEDSLEDNFEDISHRDSDDKYNTKPLKIF